MKEGGYPSFDEFAAGGYEPCWLSVCFASRRTETSFWCELLGTDITSPKPGWLDLEVSVSFMFIYLLLIQLKIIFEVLITFCLQYNNSIYAHGLTIS